jgi:hypothetical protein
MKFDLKQLQVILTKSLKKATVLYLVILFVSLVSTVLLFLTLSKDTTNRAIAYDLIVQIDDLNRIKRSIEKEYMLYEIKRNRLLNSYKRLKQRYNYLNDTVDSLNKKYDLLRANIFYQSASEHRQFENQVNNQWIVQNNIHALLESNMRLVNDSRPVLVKSRHVQTFESCINLRKCQFNMPLKIHFLNNFDKVFETPVFNSDDVYDIVADMENACLIIFYVHNQANLTNFLTSSSSINNVDSKNFLFVDLIGNSTPDEQATIQSKIESFNKCSLYASYNSIRSNLNFHFSIVKLEHLNLNRIVFRQNILFLTFKRKHLITYHANNKHLNQIKSISVVQSYFSSLPDNSIIVDVNMDCGLTGDLCFDTAKRESILLNSTFTFILNVENEWSVDNTMRLIEALSVGTIPIVLDVDVKLPLHEFIEWNEIVVRLPISRLNYLQLILLNFRDSDIISRRIKAYNVFRAYFSNLNRQFITLITLVRDRMKIPAIGFDRHDFGYEYNATLVQPLNQQSDINLDSNDIRNFLDSDEYLGKLGDLFSIKQLYKFY